jgi:hypothetical protein
VGGAHHAEMPKTGFEQYYTLKHILLIGPGAASWLLSRLSCSVVCCGPHLVILACGSSQQWVHWGSQPLRGVGVHRGAPCRCSMPCGRYKLAGSTTSCHVALQTDAATCAVCKHHHTAAASDIALFTVIARHTQATARSRVGAAPAAPPWHKQPCRPASLSLCGP